MFRSKRRCMRTSILTLSLMLAAGLAGCGQTGPLYLPQAHNKPASAAPSAATTAAPGAGTSAAPTPASR